MGDYRKLAAWQEAKQVAVDVYRLTSTFPPDERFGLIHQMRRSAVSVSSNIAEASGRGSDRSFRAFIRIARGSVLELSSQLEVAAELNLITVESAAPCLARVDRVTRLLSGMLRYRR
jgi:four helix bundle protein